VEFLVAMSIFTVVLAVAGTAVAVSFDAANTSRQTQNLNEEARQALNRMARDMRQATSIVTAVNADGAGFDATKIVAVRFQADFDGDGCFAGVGPGSCLAYSPANPEDITYCFDPSTSQLYVIDNNAPGVTPIDPSAPSCTGGQPLLAGNVGGLKLEYRSNEYRYDTTPSDGVTTWHELDAAGPPVGDSNGILDVELADVDSVVFDLEMFAGGHRQDYRTQVDLRNRSR